MSYQEFPPDPKLAAYVQCYWAIKIAGNDNNDFRLILPDGCTDVIFNFGDPLVSKSSNVLEVNSLKSFIVGNMTRPILSRSQKHTNILGIRFSAGGLHAVINKLLHEYNDLVAEFDLSEKDFWFDQLDELPSLQKRIERVNYLLLNHLKPAITKGVSFALNKIESHFGIYRIAGLSSEVGLSQKQLERQFKNFVGLTPKQYSRIIQFQYIQSLLLAKGEESLLKLAVDAGYSDHAHFTKSFKEFSGITPQQFLLQQ
jgi:AraC-like DNA-binding protein